MEQRKKGRKKILFAVLLLLIAAATGLLARRAVTHRYVYQRFSTETDSYVKGVVEEVLEENVSVTGSAAEYTTGYQKLSVRLTEGDRKGEVLEIDNYITATHHVEVKAGSHVIVCADEPENAEPYYSIYNYERNTGIWLILGAFVLLVMLIGRKQGICSCLGLLFTIMMVAGYLIPALYEGSNSFLSAVITVAVSCGVSCFCIGGIRKKTLFNMASAILGTLSAGVIYRIFMAVLHIIGCNMDRAEDLVLIAQTTGLKMGDVLVAGIMISALGAVMDVAVSMGASLGEISTLNPDRNRRALFRSGMNIGRDMIGTMTNTLILAFAGSSLTMLIVLISYGVQYNQLLSSNFLTLEIAQGLAGSMAVVLTVPISAAVCAVGYGLKIKNPKAAEIAEKESCGKVISGGKIDDGICPEEDSNNEEKSKEEKGETV